MKYGVCGRYGVFLCFYFIFHFLCPAASVRAAEIKKLLIINSYNESAPWSQEIVTPVLLHTARLKNMNADVVHMNGTFIRNDSLYRRMENGIFRRFMNRKPDYLVLIGNLAFNLRERIVNEWGDIPIVLIAETDSFAPLPYYFTGRSRNLPDDELVPLADVRNRYNFTFIEAPNKYKETVDMMVRMIPGLKKIIFSADELYLNQRLDRLVQSYITAKYPGLEYERLVGREEDENRLQNYLLADDPSTGMLFSTWFYERENLLGAPALITGDFRLISSSSQPVFALRSAYMDEGGFIGGYFYDSGELKKNLTEVIDRILQGTPARDIPFIYSERSFPIIDYRELQTSGLSSRLVPEGTVYLNRAPTFWQQYKWQMIVGVIISVALIFIALLINIFQRKKLALFRSRDYLVRNMPVSYTRGRIIFDPSGKAADVVFETGNEAFRHLPAGHAKRDRESNSPFRLEYILRFVDIVMSEKRAVSFSHYFKQSDSFYEFIICPSSEKDVIDIFGIDTTARNKAENALRESNKKLEMTLSVARIIPWRWDLTSSTIACEAQRILKHMNFTRQKGSTFSTHLIEASEYFQKVHPEDVHRIRQVYEDLVSGKLQYAKEEFRIISRVEGRRHIDWLEVNAATDQYDAQGRPVSLVGSLLLITERKKQEQSLILAREQAKESERLKSAFLANMSHEIRTPLNAIVGFSSLLTTTKDEHEKREFINIIENNNQLLLQLISDILDLAKVESNTLEFHYQVTDLNELIRQAESMVRQRLQPRVILNFAPGAADCSIVTDPNRLMQVLINLMTNACKFTSEGSITLGYEIRSGEIYFYVRDTGCGISRENQEKIFDRFTKVNEFVQGTGLGLSICRNIVSKMKGRIGVESEGEGKGSIFWFTVPYTPGKTEVKPIFSVSVKEKEVVRHKKITLLVAEDNESNYLLFHSILGKEFDLIHAWNGEEAVELYRIHQPHIVIMDINMPRMDGYEATREIRKISESVPIIAVTAYAFASDKEKIIKSGFNGYVSKPVSAHKLKEELQFTINRSFIFL